MNTLSITLYLIDIISNLSITLGIGLSCLFFATVLLVPAVIISYIEEDAHLPNVISITKKFFIATLVLVVINVFIPSKTTLYGIAISEVGEMALTNEKVSNLFEKTTKLLEKKLDEELSEK